MNFKRKSSLIKPGLQLNLVVYFLAATILSLVLQFTLFAWRIVETSHNLVADGNALMADLPDILVDVFLLSFGLLVPLTLMIGIVTTFRTAGPIHRFETFLRGVSLREHPRPCSLRKEDQLHDFCDLLNRATEPLREQCVEPEEEDDETLAA